MELEIPSFRAPPSSDRPVRAPALVPLPYCLPDLLGDVAGVVFFVGGLRCPLPGHVLSSSGRSLCFPLERFLNPVLGRHPCFLHRCSHRSPLLLRLLPTLPRPELLLFHFLQHPE